MELFAHSLEGRPTQEWETLQSHLENVARESGKRAAIFDAASFAEIAGWLHDLGKIKPAFQAKLRGVANREGHSAEGGLYARDSMALAGKMLAYCIAGHHAGLANGLERSDHKPFTPLAERLKQCEVLSLPEWVKLPDLKPPALFASLTQESLPYSGQFFIRMLFSALVDADFIETERFYTPDVPRDWEGTYDQLNSSLKKYLSRFPEPDAEDVVSCLRAEVLQGAEAQAQEPPGLFSLTVPTGGGKTLSSLKFALEHMRIHGLRRVIYVVPYTSIIEQTADVFRSALGDHDAVLEHHSSFDFDGMEDEAQAERMKLAAQNWDRPIVVTTAVQFFESLYANRTSKCRKLHNIAGSVVILDEAQNLPIGLLRPSLAALKELTCNYRCSVVLCTATQPALYRETGLAVNEALSQASTREIAPDPDRLFEQLKRVEVTKLGVKTNSELVASLAGRSALVIVNNKRQARALYDELRGEHVFHLSTNMTAVHRREVLACVREKLRLQPVLLISTALVEAGVDLDFPEVWRAVAGIDSIAQAAGRCNREGKLKKGNLYLFEPEEGYAPPPELKLNGEIALQVLDRFQDPLSREAVDAYFQALYWSRSGELDAKGIISSIEACGNELNYNFADVAAKMRLIDSMNVPLIIGSGPYGLDEDARQHLKFSPHAGVIAQLMQRYSVQVSPNVRAKLLASRAASIIRPDEFGDQFVVLDNLRLYDEHAGFAGEDVEDLGFALL